MFDQWSRARVRIGYQIDDLLSQFHEDPTFQSGLRARKVSVVKMTTRQRRQKDDGLIHKNQWSRFYGNFFPNSGFNFEYHPAISF